MVLTAADEVSTEQRRGVVLAALAQRDAQVLPLNASTTSTQRALGTMSRENRRRGVGSASVRGLVPRTGSAPAGLVELEETARRQLRNGTKLAQHCRKLAGSVRDNGRRLAAADERSAGRLFPAGGWATGGSVQHDLCDRGRSRHAPISDCADRGQSGGRSRGAA